MSIFSVENRAEYTVTVNETTIQCFLSQCTPYETNDFQEKLIRYNLHTHAYGELFFCHHDSIQINFELTSALLSLGDILYIPAGIPHVCITPNLNRNFSGFGIQCTAKSPQGFQKHLSPLLDSVQPMILRNQPKAVHEWEKLLYDNVKVNPEVLTLQLITQLIQTISCGFFPFSQSAHIGSPISYKNIQCLSELEYIIDSQFMTRLSRQDVAEKLFISKRQLDRICQKRFGRSFHEQITERRLSAAVQILLETDQTAEIISQQVGFPSKSSFYHDFTRKFNITPYQFRKKHQNNE